ncbi:MAG TPA: GNAT family N-acetyltransferase [Candidatus Limnocylindrales bacterium]|jgi:ribosomal protein S18 acetylase RimI-like enzyme|nr:GNAT family N-acetyltransferase [Candidatus Limnocylindrales bacterium]
MSDKGPTGVRFRRPAEADHAPIVRLVDEWWGGRRMSGLLQRVWFQHFTGTSWIAEDDDRHLLGFLIGFVSPDDPTVGYVKMIATNPNQRRRGVGAALYRRFFGDVASRGVRRVEAITWPGNRQSVAFHRSVGFRLTDGPGTQNLYGSPAFPDYDGEGEDRVLFVREIGPEDSLVED